MAGAGAEGWRSGVGVALSMGQGEGAAISCDDLKQAAGGEEGVAGCAAIDILIVCIAIGVISRWQWGWWVLKCNGPWAPSRNGSRNRPVRHKLNVEGLVQEASMSLTAHLADAVAYMLP